MASIVDLRVKLLLLEASDKLKILTFCATLILNRGTREKE